MLRVYDPYRYRYRTPQKFRTGPNDSRIKCPVILFICRILTPINQSKRFYSIEKIRTSNS
ncbi:hypothetical protein BofuT4_uP163090.1 [Botrytis cinerea T4]|uniref:Uncharacterized protein n=1 Tax=Botryotinia fuckeliana (strain T4) TaxID=999810 RepID=G2YTB6_BOTF4|nr:hypothetical protein BofuT4_uP163090.1 [Botrytis cinerea T4]